MVSKGLNLIKYHFLYHIIWLLCQLFPNLHVFNLVRGFLLGVFFKKAGRRFSIARGVTIVMVRNVEIGDDVYIAHDCWINGTGGLVISHGAIISPKVVIATTKHEYINGGICLKKSSNEPMYIGIKTWICSNSTLTKGAMLNDGCILASNSCLGHKTQPYTLYGGTPAKYLKILYEN